MFLLRTTKDPGGRAGRPSSLLLHRQRHLGRPLGRTGRRHGSQLYLLQVSIAYCVASLSFRADSCPAVLYQQGSTERARSSRTRCAARRGGEVVGIRGLRTRHEGDPSMRPPRQLGTLAQILHYRLRLVHPALTVHQCRISPWAEGYDILPISPARLYPFTKSHYPEYLPITIWVDSVSWQSSPAAQSGNNS
jgi:hypothetical protein